MPELTIRCGWAGCENTAALPDDGNGRIPLAPLTGWFYPAMGEEGWLCPEHAPAFARPQTSDSGAS